MEYQEKTQQIGSDALEVGNRLSCNHQRNQGPFREVRAEVEGHRRKYQDLARCFGMLTGEMLMPAAWSTWRAVSRGSKKH